MSYDYNALVSAIASARRKAAAASSSKADRLEHLQMATESLERLSFHCPMTPLLWIQYARTVYDFMCEAASPNSKENSAAGEETNHTTIEKSSTAANELRLQTLELGLQEFPGSALLQLYYVHHHLLLVSEDVDWKRNREEAVVVAAMDAVGKGSHRNEGPWIALLYKWQAELFAEQYHHTVDDCESSTETASIMARIEESFIKRSRIPMKDANDSLAAEYREFCRHHSLPLSEAVQEAMEQGRRLESRVYSRFVSFEDEIDIAMHEEGILARHVIPPTTGGTVSEAWLDQLELSGNQMFGMGMGGAATASAFIKYTLALQDHSTNEKQQRSRKRKVDRESADDDDTPDQLELERENLSLALAVYERAIAECPTVEVLWLSFIRCLLERLHSGDIGTVHNSVGDDTTCARRLQAVVQRAVRNCPNSQSLVEQQLHTAFVLAQLGLVVLDPDGLLSIVEYSLEKKFLPGRAPYLALYLQAIRIVKRRILHLLSSPNKSAKGLLVTFDEPEALPSKNQAPTINLDGDTKQEVSDLLEDMQDMFEEVEERLQKAHAAWTEGRAMLCRECAYTKLFLVAPLQRALSERDSPPLVSNEDGSQCASLSSFERCIRVHNPPHPAVYLSYIRQYSLCTPTDSAVDVATKLRRIRFLYQKGVSSVGRPKSLLESSVVFPDYDSSLSSLCQEWIEFESFFGSARSIGRARKAIQRKVQKAIVQNIIPVEKSAHTEAPGDQHDQAPDLLSKKLKHGAAPDEAEIANASIDSADASEVVPPKYKAHPFTIRVSNLDLTTEDMDLVDIFRAKCGTVAHAKIIRDKALHGRGVSRGWGLVQFEERESVAKALSLNDVLGIHEMVVEIEPSHMPAVALVPPGFHRVNAKGQGKSSKRNEARKERKTETLAHVDASPALSGITDSDADATVPARNSLKAEKSPSVLAFRPRGLARHKKVQLD
jgi:hypothetical protein